MTLLDVRAIASLRALAAEVGPGDVLEDRFELKEPIGEGAMGLVYSAWDRQAEREVAIKLIEVTDAEGEARFEREARALASVAHPNVVRYIAEGAHGTTRFLVMDRLRGRTLADTTALGRLPVAGTIALGRSVAEGLAALHAAALVHRDLKPSNVFLVDGAPSAARILDFGLARGKEGLRITKTGALVGTPGYMAPEQVRGDRAIGPRADVFALGCVLFECLTGQAAFFQASIDALCAQILLEEPPLVRKLRPEVSLGLEALVEQMMSKRESARPDAAEVARALAALDDELRAAVPATLPGADPAARLTEGAIVAGKYKVEHVLGEGGMGIVVAAKHLELGTRVALKVLRGRGTAKDDARFLREAQAVARLESEHVARVLDVARFDDGAPFLVMEYLRGEDLARRLRDEGPLAIEEAVGYVLEACEALEEAHALGIVHRDLKPSNLFLTQRRDGTRLVKVLDFGISKITRPLEDAGGDVSLTGATAVIGSAPYMSPEQLHDSKQVDARSDLWSLGVVLHELVTGNMPFHADTPAAVGARIASAKPRRLREELPTAPAGLEAVVLRCLQKVPGERYADVAALREALAPFAPAGTKSPARVTPTPTPPATRKRHTGVLVVCSLAAASLLAAAGLALPRGATPTPTALPSSAPSSPSSTSPQAQASTAAAASTTPPASTATASSPHLGVSRLEDRRAPAASSPAKLVPIIAPLKSPTTPASPPRASATARDIDVRDPALEGR